MALVSEKNNLYGLHRNEVWTGPLMQVKFLVALLEGLQLTLVPAEIAIASALLLDLKCGIFILLRLDEKLCDLVLLAQVLYRLLVSNGGGFEFSGSECLVVDILEFLRSEHSLHPMHVLRLGSVVLPIQLVLED